MGKWKTPQEKKCNSFISCLRKFKVQSGSADVNVQNVHEKVTARHKSHLILVKKYITTALDYCAVISPLFISRVCSDNSSRYDFLLLWSPIWATLDGLFLGLDLMKKGVHLMELPTDAKRRRAAVVVSLMVLKFSSFSNFSPSNWSSAVSCERGAPFKTHTHVILLLA